MTRPLLYALCDNLLQNHAAEDWYKNDYPEEEDERSDDDDGSEGSDVFHEDSESDDVAHQRGQWDLGQDDD